MKEISLRRTDIKALVDDEDYAALVAMGRWRLARGGYVVLCGGDNYTTRMHNVILGDIPIGLECDHVNRIKHDNQRLNLKIKTHSNNCQNKNVKDYRGVAWVEDKQQWRVRIMKDYKAIHVGYFSKLIDALGAYNERALILFGTDAALNPIPNEDQ